MRLKFNLLLIYAKETNEWILDRFRELQRGCLCDVSYLPQD